MKYKTEYGVATVTFDQKTGKVSEARLANGKAVKLSTHERLSLEAQHRAHHSSKHQAASKPAPKRKAKPKAKAAPKAKAKAKAKSRGK